MPPLGFNFQAPNRPFVSAPTEAFSGLADTTERKYNEGEQIVEAAKDLLGNINVAPDDQIERNAYALEIDEGFDQLVEDYGGAFESKRFQRDSKAFIRKMAKDPRIKGFQDTLQEVEWEKNARRESQASGNPMIPIGDETKPKATTFNEETGQWESYKSPYETGQDWLADAKNHVAQLPLKKGTTEPILELLKGIGPMLKTGQYSETDISGMQGQLDQVVDNFANSNEGGRQLARKIMNDHGIANMYDRDGKMNETVDAGLRDFLYAANAIKNPITKSTMYNYQYLPKAYLDEGAETKESPYDVTLPFDVTTAISSNLGFDTRIVDGFAPTQKKTTEELPEGVEDNRANNAFWKQGISSPFNQSATKTTGYAFAPSSVNFYERFSPKEKVAYDDVVNQLATTLLGKGVDSSSQEARELVSDYTEAVETLAQNPTFKFYERLGEEGRSARDDASSDIKNNWPNKAVYSFKGGILKDSQVKELDKTNLKVIGEINPKHSITKLSNNPAFTNSYYVTDSETGDAYLFTMPEYRQKGQGEFNILKNALYNDVILKPGLKTSMGNIVENITGLKNIEARSNITKDGEGKIQPTGTYDLWIDGEQLTVDGEPMAFNDFDKMLNTLLVLKYKK